MLTENKAKLYIGKAFALKQQIDSLTKKYNQTRNNIYEFLDYSKTSSLEAFEVGELGTKQGKLKATKVERITSIKYDIPKLKKKLDKELVNEIVDKTYTINDIDAMIALLKKAGVRPKDFKKLISVSETVNNGKIQQAYSVGDISLKDISDAYQVTVSKSLQIRQISEKD